MTSSSEMRGEAPKIVQIETRYVETDEVNFRDVVQSLTGKNSSTDWIGQNNAAAAASSSEIKAGIAVTVKPEEGVAAATSKESHLPSMLMNNNINMSFKDFDTLLLELPLIHVQDAMPWS